MRKTKFLFFYGAIIAGLTFIGCDSVEPQRPVAVDFILKDLDGNDFQLSKQQGKPVVMMFFQTTCSVCREEVPILNKIDSLYKAQGLVTVAISMEADSVLTDYQEEQGVKYPILIDKDKRVSLVGYGIQYVPTFYIFDKEGNIILNHLIAQPTPLSQSEIEYVVRPLLGLPR